MLVCVCDSPWQEDQVLAFQNSPSHVFVKQPQLTMQVLSLVMLGRARDILFGYSAVAAEVVAFSFMVRKTL